MNDWTLLQPLQIRNTTMRNRIVMAAMEARLNTPDGSVTHEMIDYYAARARGGAGAVVIENTYIDAFSSRSGIISSGIYSDHMIAGKSLLADAIRDEGALAILQLSHGGPQANPAANSYPVLTPSLYPGIQTAKENQVLTVRQIQEIEEAFAQAARRAYFAGFHGVELHAAHGYLLSSFLSPLRNLRQDEYGVTPEGRARIVVEIIEKIRPLVSRDFIVGVRMNVTDGIPGGVDTELACRTAKLLEEHADYLSVSGGFSETCGDVMITPNYVPAPTLAEQIAAVKRAVSQIPVFGVGALDYASAEQCLKNDWFDAAVFGRAMIADPEWPNKLAAGCPGEIRSCCRGNEGCFSRMLKGLPIRCEVNPACGQEAKYRIEKTAAPRNVVVVGGGVAGMECARLGALMGHHVTLLEKERELGGHLIEAGAPDFKSGTKKLLDWQVHQLEKCGVDVRLQTAATAELLESLRADWVILAVGSSYLIPPIPGIEHAMTPDQALKHPETVGSRVVIIGGGMVGAETALSLSENGRHTVTLLEMREEVAPEHDPVARSVLEKRLRKNGVTLCFRSTATEIHSGGAAYTDPQGKVVMVPADTVVIAAGLRANTPQQYTGARKAEVRMVGDCSRVGKIYQAMHGAWKTMFDLERGEAQ